MNPHLPIRWRLAKGYTLLILYNQCLAGKDGAPRGESVHPQEVCKVHLVFLCDNVGRVSLQDLICLCPYAGRFCRGAGNDQDLPDAQIAVAQSIQGLDFLGGRIESIGDFPEGIAFLDHILGVRRFPGLESLPR